MHNVAKLTTSAFNSFQIKGKYSSTRFLHCRGEVTEKYVLSTAYSKGKVVHNWEGKGLVQWPIRGLF